MSVSNDIAEIIDKNKKPVDDQYRQLKMLEDVENVLKKMGISLEPRFEIPLSHRIKSPYPEKDA